MPQSVRSLISAFLGVEFPVPRGEVAPVGRVSVPGYEVSDLPGVCFQGLRSLEWFGVLLLMTSLGCFFFFFGGEGLCPGCYTSELGVGVHSCPRV